MSNLSIYIYIYIYIYIELSDLENEMGGACSVYRGEERRVQGFGGKT
jgi:hypothetical protein